MNQDQQKRSAAIAALDYIKPKLSANSVVGVGTGSTANHFIDALADVKHLFDACVASSDETAARLKGHGVPVVDLNAADDVIVYVDGADEFNGDRQLVKGGGGALTREKIVAASAAEFVCIVDVSKRVARLGRFPLPVEVIPMARGLVARALRDLGAYPVLREGSVTDNGNLILDVHDLDLSDPLTMEQRLNNLVGTVCNGIFAANPADVVLMAGPNGVQRL